MSELSAEKLAELREIAGKVSNDYRPDWRYYGSGGMVPEGTEIQFARDGGWLDMGATDFPVFIAAFDPPTVLAMLDLIAEQQAELAQVEAFINQRPEYVTALKNTRGGDSLEDYYRWSGHAEARRQLATSLNRTTPYEPGEKATRYEVTDDE